MNERDRIIATMTQAERALYVAKGGSVPLTPSPRPQWYEVDRRFGAGQSRIERYYQLRNARTQSTRLAS